MSDNVYAVHVAAGEIDEPNRRQLRNDWHDYVVRPAREAGRTPPELVSLASPYRLVVSPILNYVLELEKKYPDCQIAVLIPELVEQRWYHYFLHGQRGALLKTLLYLKGNQRIVVVNVPWYLSD